MTTMNHTSGNLKKVLRFEYSSEIIEQVTAFANVHRYDDRKTYKESWTAWLAHDEIATLLTAEIARLNDLGYKGDVADKLFKSGRYYFRGKQLQSPNQIQNQNQNQNQNQSQKPSRVRYVTVSRSLLDVMDEHIERGVRSNNAYTPATGFTDFCNAHADDTMLKAEVASLFERYSPTTATTTATTTTATTTTATTKTICEKLKKTYKNRYFMIMNSV